MPRTVLPFIVGEQVSKRVKPAWVKRLSKMQYGPIVRHMNAVDVIYGTVVSVREEDPTYGDVRFVLPATGTYEGATWVETVRSSTVKLCGRTRKRKKGHRTLDAATVVADKQGELFDPQKFAEDWYESVNDDKGKAPEDGEEDDGDENVPGGSEDVEASGTTTTRRSSGTASTRPNKREREQAVYDEPLWEGRKGPKPDRDSPTASFIGQAANMSVADIFMRFLPVSWLVEHINISNSIMAATQQEWKNITVAEFKTWAGLSIGATLDNLPMRSHWAKKSSGLITPTSFGKYMSRNRYEDISTAFDLACMCAHEQIGQPANRVERKAYQRRALKYTAAMWAAWNENMVAVWKPGVVITVDETMIPWRGKGGSVESAMPHKMKESRKPTKLKEGRELKTATCGDSNIIIRAAVVYGTAAVDHIGEEEDLTSSRHRWPAFSNKLQTLNKTTATSLRLTMPWWHTDRIVVADSWFGSVEAALALRAKGLYCVFNVKKKMGFPVGFPGTLLADKMGSSTEQGLVAAVAGKLDMPEHVSGPEVFTSAEGPVDLMGVSFRIGKQVLHYVTTCSTANLVGETTKWYVDGSGGWIHIEVDRPEVAEDYSIYRSGVDINNHLQYALRHISVSVAPKRSWAFREFGAMLQIAESNAYAAFQYLHAHDATNTVIAAGYERLYSTSSPHEKFRNELSLELAAAGAAEVDPQPAAPPDPCYNGHVCHANSRRRCQPCGPGSCLKHPSQKPTSGCVPCNAPLCSGECWRLHALKRRERESEGQPPAKRQRPNASPV